VGSIDDPPQRAVPALPLLLICAAAAAFRFVGLSWGAPYFHFHIDEHYVFQGADMLRRSVREAAISGKFFMYGPLTMWTLNGVRAVHDRLAGPLVLTLNADEVTYMIMGREISAAFGTACVPLVYIVGRRVASRTAGLIAALLLACAVVQLRESHFFSVDTVMLFFAVLAWIFALRIAETGRTRDYVFAGLSLGAAVACKYTALFLLAVIGVAHLCSPRRPQRLADTWGCAAWVLRGLTPVFVGLLLFVAVDPMAISYYDKFRADIVYWVVGVNSGTWRPIYVAQFADVRPWLYWFTNILWWGLGPAFEIAGVAGVLWLLARRDRQAVVAATFPIAYYAAAAQGIAPFMRYAAPLAAGLAVSAAVLCADLVSRPRLRWPAIALTVVICGSTALYAVAYMHVFLSPDSRLTASAWLLANVPRDAKVLVEPSHNRPPTGTYLSNDVDFNGDYVMWGTTPSNRDRHDYYELHTLDTYRTLYNRGPSDDDRRAYIRSRVALADWIVIDDTFIDFYQHLPESEHGVVKQYYRDLFAGRLGFRLVKTFKVYPSLFGYDIIDDGAELTFRLFDHPKVFVFARSCC
jgi:4-amino-4-deoxy-L-arabinose transferase-like glycosyltransferase